jgi:hypothetical protein
LQLHHFFKGKNLFCTQRLIVAQKIQINLFPKNLIIRRMTDEIKKMKSDVQKMGKSSETLLKNVQV